MFASSTVLSPPAYGNGRLAAVLAASTLGQAPLTAILLLFELTRDYRIVSCH
jgi:H+/Cl- antiporter ClcA